MIEKPYNDCFINLTIGFFKSMLIAKFVSKFRRNMYRNLKVLVFKSSPETLTLPLEIAPQKHFSITQIDSLNSNGHKARYLKCS